MPRTSGSGSDSEESVKSFTTARSDSSTVSYTAAAGSSTFQANTGQPPAPSTPPPVPGTPPAVSITPPAVSASPVPLTASPTASPTVSLAATPPASPPPLPAVDPPGQNPVGVFDVEAQTFLAADAQQSAVYRWSQDGGKWLSENREHVKRFAFEAVPLILQSAGKGTDNNHLNMAGVGLAGVKNAAYLVQAGVNYYNTGDKAYLAQGAAAVAGLGGAVASGYGNDTTLPQSSQNNWQSAGAAFQAGSATWSYTSPAAQQQPAPTDPAASATTVNPTSVPAPTAASSSSPSLPADQQQPPILPAGREVVGRQDSVATGVSTGSTTTNPAPVRRTTTMVQRTNTTNGANGNGTGRARSNS
ncbi:hypothetical protein ABZV29_04380 [Streptomyces sp. NPDC005236]|uniref:hypothetical protein n=1 Tax=Streptomyces sp. NPDC005236 TaxID=3157028 RepID=UPI0033A1E4DE